MAVAEVRAKPIVTASHYQFNVQRLEFVATSLLVPESMTSKEISHLRILIANERRDRLELLAQVVTGLGHEVIASEIDVREVGAVTARKNPTLRSSGSDLAPTMHSS